MKSFKQFLNESDSKQINDIYPSSSRTSASQIKDKKGKTFYLNFYKGVVKVESSAGKLYKNMRFTTSDELGKDVAAKLRELGFTYA